MASQPPDDIPVLTRSAYDRLKAELEELTTDGRRRVAERLLRARELGDISENAEYEATKDEQGMLEARIRKLEYMIRHAQIVQAPVASEEIVPGILVDVVPAEDPQGDPETYLVAASSEERVPGARTVSVKSPLGQALQGKRVGDTVTYQAPAGTFSYRVVSVRPAGG
jgi:transcription elongation factor GreA